MTASVYLGAGDSFTLSNAANVFGSSGSETVTVNAGVAGVVLDQNIEAVNLAAFTGIKYLQAGSVLKVYGLFGNSRGHQV